MPLALLLLLQLLLTDHLVNVQIRKERVELIVLLAVVYFVVGSAVGRIVGPVRRLWLIPQWSVGVRRRFWCRT